MKNRFPLTLTIAQDHGKGTTHLRVSARFEAGTIDFADLRVMGFDRTGMFRSKIEFAPNDATGHALWTRAALDQFRALGATCAYVGASELLQCLGYTPDAIRELKLTSKGYEIAL